jgi:hypothetical protein
MTEGFDSPITAIPRDYGDSGDTSGKVASGEVFWGKIV